MRIALDYDETFSADPELWKQFTELARAKGHEVFILTRRAKSSRPVPEEGYYDVIYCDNEDKITRMMELGHKPADIYIDDKPWELGQPSR